MKDKRPLILVVAIVLVIVAYYGWQYIQKIQSAGKISASGTIEAVEVQVGSKAYGKVLSLSVDEGSTVNKGDVLAKIDVPEVLLQLESAKAAEKFSKLNFDRISDLYGQGMASKQQYDAADLQYVQSKSALDTVTDQADDANINAPVSGIILVKAVEAGELVSPGSVVFTMADLRDLELKLYVSETEVGKINLGDKAVLSVDSYPGQKFSGAVKYISSQAEFTPKDIQTKEERVNEMFEVKVDIPNEGLKLKPGMPADAQIQILNPKPETPNKSKTQSTKS